MPDDSPTLVLFDDGRGHLAPLTDLRAAFDLRTGALTTIDRYRRALRRSPAAVFVPSALEPLTRERHAAPGGPLVNELPAGDGPILCVNGRCPMPSGAFLELEPGEQIIESGSNAIVAACLTRADSTRLLKGESVRAATIDAMDPPTLMERPWHFKAFRDSALGTDLNLLAGEPTRPLPAGVVQIGKASPVIHPSATVYPTAVIDTEHGGVFIAEGAVIRPGATVCGPCAIGAGSTVSDHAVIRGGTAIGPRCKVAGEVSGCVFQGLANKAHDGFLGDSYVGEWVNLGAGTTNSNLLNTYSEVVAQAAPGGHRERTGETFLGCVLGDHTKTAICTRIMTGSIVGTGVMHAAVAPITGNTPPFAWVTDEGRRMFRFERLIETAETMMARRQMEPSSAYVDRLADLFRAAHQYFA